MTLAIDEAETILGHSLLADITDHHTGEIHPVILVTDNGPAFKSLGFASRRELEHVRSRGRSPHTTGVRERGFGSLKYEHLYRHDITDGSDLARHAEHYRRIFNHTRPHEALDWARPADTYQTATPNYPDPRPEPTT